MRLILEESVVALIPAPARMSLRRMNRTPVWLVNEFLRHRNMSTDSFSDHIREQLQCEQDKLQIDEPAANLMIGDIVLAGERVEKTLDIVFPFQPETPYGVYVDTIKPLTKDLNDGTVIAFTRDVRL